MNKTELFDTIEQEVLSYKSPYCFVDLGEKEGFGKNNNLIIKFQGYGTDDKVVISVTKEVEKDTFEVVDNCLVPYNQSNVH